ncbi:MAG TPA: cytochrome c oxidase subunit II [Geobacteraceae bacterium]
MYPDPLTTTKSVDPIFIFIFGTCIVLFIGIAVTMVAFVIRYHRSRAPEPTSQVSSNIWLEVVWSGLPTVLVMVMFYYGWIGYLSLRQIPKDALEVTATARTWSWSFTYANGKTSPKLYVPVGKPVLVNLVSLDVLHGFYLPAFRVKHDVVPGMKNHVWFMADKPGSYDLFCSVYCGTGHSGMITTVEAVPPAQFANWLQQSGGEEHAGKELLEKHGCLGCHTLDGTPKVGPTLKGLWGRRESILTGGREHAIVVDEAYVRRSILDPQADIVKGFPPVMPSYAGKLSDADMAAIIDFLRRGAKEPARLDGAKLARDKGCLACHSLDGSRGVGPTFKGVYNSRVTVMEGGTRRTVVADDAYLRESIIKPKAKIVEGFQPVMPDFPDLKEDEVEALVEFIEGVK